MLQRAIDEYQGPSRQLAAMADGDLPKAAELLDGLWDRSRRTWQPRAADRRRPPDYSPALEHRRDTLHRPREAHRRREDARRPLGDAARGVGDRACLDYERITSPLSRRRSRPPFARPSGCPPSSSQMRQDCG